MFRRPPWPPEAVSSTVASVWKEIEADAEEDISPYDVAGSRLNRVTVLLKKAAERFRHFEHYLENYREEAAAGAFQPKGDRDDLRMYAFLVGYGRKYQQVLDLLDRVGEKLEVAWNTFLEVPSFPRRTDEVFEAALKLRRSRLEDALADLKLYEFSKFVSSINESCSSAAW
ncbi:MAG: hypothetical protein M1812_006317 [Candelaria pacifica]|nr:MAG: hypothetical protein M1812_006317 [Candelaria pacifica]